MSSSGHSRTPVAANDMSECPVFETPRAFCAECRGHRAAPVGDLEIVRQFRAQYDGRCANCGSAYNKGERIGTLADGDGYACRSCCDQHDGLDPTLRVLRAETAPAAVTVPDSPDTDPAPLHDPYGFRTGLTRPRRAAS